jgi:hypothetical protein
MTDIPNFALWSNENLAKFSKDSYIKMQDQQEQIEQLQLYLKHTAESVQELRKLLAP